MKIEISGGMPSAMQEFLAFCLLGSRPPGVGSRGNAEADRESPHSKVTEILISYVNIIQY